MKKLSKIREFLKNKQVIEALRLWVINDLMNTSTYDHLFAPMLEGNPATIAVHLKKRRIIRVTPVQTYKTEYEDAQADLKEANAKNKDLKKEVTDNQIALTKVTEELAKAKETIKQQEKTIKTLTSKKPAKTDEPDNEDIVS